MIVNSYSSQIPTIVDSCLTTSEKSWRCLVPARAARNGRRQLAAFSGPAFSAAALLSIALTAPAIPLSLRAECSANPLFY
jgi:hypothetical protein